MVDCTVACHLFCGYPATAEERVVTFVGDPWSPYVEGELGEDAVSGIAVKIVFEIFSRIDNTRAWFPLIPWQRALEEVEQGYHDGIGMLLKTPEREVYMTYSIPFIIGSSLAWSVSNKEGKAFEWDQIEDFFGKCVGIIQGYSYGDRLEQAFASKTIIAVVEALAKDFPDAGIVAAKKPIESDIYYLSISKNHQQSY